MAEYSLATERRAVGRFAVVGLLGCVVQLAVFALLSGPAGWSHVPAAVLATSIALCGNFVLNRIWTFEAHGREYGPQALRFVVVSAVAIGANVAVLIVLVDVLGAPKLGAEAVAVCFQAPISYVGNRVWTFA